MARARVGNGVLNIGVPVAKTPTLLFEGRRVKLPVIGWTQRDAGPCYWQDSQVPPARNASSEQAAARSASV